MSNENQFRVLLPEDAAAITQLEKSRFAENISDPFEQELSSWNAKWRGEALEHYLPLGWSFGVWENDQLAGYFLAQPQLFVGGLSQSLWVEHLAATNNDLATQLIDIAQKIAREKHLQRALFSIDPGLAANLQINWRPLKENILEIRTAKYHEE